MKPVANGNAGLSCTDGGSASITGSPSTKVKAEGAGVFFGPLSVSVSGATQGVCANAAGAGVINPTAAKSKSGGQAPIREGDSGSVTVIGTQTVNPFGPCSFSVTVEVDDAGQGSVKSK